MQSAGGSDQGLLGLSRILTPGPVLAPPIASRWKTSPRAPNVQAPKWVLCPSFVLHPWGGGDGSGLLSTPEIESACPACSPSQGTQASSLPFQSGL